MILDYAWWIRLLGTLAGEAAILSALAWLGLRFISRPQAQRLILRTALVAWIGLWTVEFAGLRAWVQPLLEHSIRPAKPLAGLTPLISSPSWQAPALLDQPEGTAAGPEILRPSITFPAIGQRTSAPPTRTATVTATRSNGPIYWPAWVWFAGLLILAGRTTLGRLWLAWRSTSPTGLGPSGNVSAADGTVIVRLQRRLGLKNVRVLAQRGLAGPIAFGIRRRTLVLPEDFAARFSVTQREAIIAHELAHLASRDPLWLLIADILTAWAWWHPAAHWLSRSLRAASETTADQASDLIPGGSIALAESLLKLGKELANGAPRFALDLTGSGMKSHLALRIAALLSRQPVPEPSAPNERWITAWLAAAGVLALGAAPIPLLAFHPPATVIREIWRSRTSRPILALALPATKETAAQAHEENVGIRYLKEWKFPPALAISNAPDPLFHDVPPPSDFQGSFRGTNLSLQPNGTYSLTVPVSAGGYTALHYTRSREPDRDEAMLLPAADSTALNATPTPRPLVLRCAYLRLGDALNEASGLRQLLRRLPPLPVDQHWGTIPESNSVTGAPLAAFTVRDTNAWIVISRYEFMALAPFLHAMAKTNFLQAPAMQLDQGHQAGLALLQDSASFVPDPAVRNTNGIDFFNYAPFPQFQTNLGPKLHAFGGPWKDGFAELILEGRRQEFSPADNTATLEGKPKSPLIMRSYEVFARPRFKAGEVLAMELPSEQYGPASGNRSTERIHEYMLVEVDAPPQ